ncbi:VOC family protein [uncultured Maribacter sp.]|uniref:VOC family protein n=1 Tax=uncultured Maribacter sp. TaxID=431308 RepID=UPI00260D72A4|nr:VOC family protein [uncultured Maribacter sp.]
MTSLLQTTLYVDNVEKTIKFYTNIFGLKEIYISSKKNYGELSLNGTILAFASNKLANYNLKNGFTRSNISEKPFGFELMFHTENVKEVMQNAINAGAKEEEPVTRKPWMREVGYLRDENGFLIEVCSFVKNNM